MNRDYNKELQNFKAVWARVSGEAQSDAGRKSKPAAGEISLMPRKGQKSRTARFGPPR